MPGEFITLSFTSSNIGGGSGEHIDGVSLLVTSVPEPATLAILGLGLAILGVFRRKKLARN